MLHQTIDGEVVIINLATGNYYSLRHTAAEMWSAIERGAAPEEITAELAAKYLATLETLEASTARFLDELRTEGLIEVDDDAAGRPLLDEKNRPSGTFPFEPPVVEKFADMQDLIMLDPVHEVEEEGWPHASREKKLGSKS